MKENMDESMNNNSNLIKRFIYRSNVGLIYENIIVYIVFILTWLGFGNYMAVVILLAFLIDLFFKKKRLFLFADKIMLLLILSFVFFSLVSSLLSIDKLKSSLLSMLWFFVIYVPYSYVRFSMEDNYSNFFIKYIVPSSFIISIIIIGYLEIRFVQFSINHGIHFNRRYTFLWLGKATTPDTIVMLTGIGYAFVRSLKTKLSNWLSFLYLLFCGIGIILTYDRGGVVSYFVISLILLSFDYKRLILFIIVIALIIFLSFKIKSLMGIKHYFNFIYSQRIQKALGNRQQLDTFKTAWSIIKDYWFFGVGTNNFSKFTKNHGSGHWYAYAHNFILQFWAENGILGLITALSIIGLTFKRWIYTIRNIKPEYKNYVLGIGVSFIGILVGNLTNSTIWILKIALPFWMIVGIINGFYINFKNGVGIKIEKP